MKKSIVLFLSILIKFGFGQDIHFPTTYSLNIPFKGLNQILKIKNDSAIIYCERAPKFKKPALYLVNLNSGEILKEVEMEKNNYLSSKFDLDNDQLYRFSLKNDSLQLFTVTYKKEKIVITKRTVNNDLTLSNNAYVYSFNMERKYGLFSFNIKTNTNFIELSAFNGGLENRMRKTEINNFKLFTLTHNLTKLDSFEYNNNKEFSLKQPTEFNNYNILYELNIKKNNFLKFEKVLLKPDNKGKIEIARTGSFENTRNFMFLKDSVNKTYGYCVSYEDSKGKGSIYKINPFVIDFKSGGVEINPNPVIEKQIPFCDLEFINTQSIYANNKFKALVNICEITGNPLSWRTHSASYFEISNKSLTTHLSLSLNSLSYSNPLLNMADIKMIPFKNNTILVYNHANENDSFNEKAPYGDFKKIDMEQTKGIHPVIIAIFNDGTISKNLNYSKGNRWFLESYEAFSTADGVYVPLIDGNNLKIVHFPLIKD